MSVGARMTGRAFVEQSVPPELWARNGRFCEELIGIIRTHPLVEHPIIGALSEGRFDLDAMRRLHLEFHHAFSVPFTDALLMAMFRGVELERRFGPEAKIACRFLLQLNLLDELGFLAGGFGDEYIGNPRRAHLLQLEETLMQLGVSRRDIDAYVPSRAAVLARRALEESYGDLAQLATVLAAAETVFTRFTRPWARNVGIRTDVDTSTGYHAIHVDHEGEFLDDDHAEDLWFVVRQALVPGRYDEVRAKLVSALGDWKAFLDAQITSERAEVAAASPPP